MCTWCSGPSCTASPWWLWWPPGSRRQQGASPGQPASPRSRRVCRPPGRPSESAGGNGWKNTHFTPEPSSFQSTALSLNEAEFFFFLKISFYPSCGFLIGLGDELTLRVASLGQHLDQRLLCRTWRRRRRRGEVTGRIHFFIKPLKTSPLIHISVRSEIKAPS